VKLECGGARNQTDNSQSNKYILAIENVKIMTILLPPTVTLHIKAIARRWIAVSDAIKLQLHNLIYS
jgi:hypothetical protein